jgi:hypothetical protein
LKLRTQTHQRFLATLQRKHASLQRHTAEASMDQREHASLQRHQEPWATTPPAQSQRKNVSGKDFGRRSFSEKFLRWGCAGGVLAHDAMCRCRGARSRWSIDASAVCRCREASSRWSMGENRGWCFAKKRGCIWVRSFKTYRRVHTRTRPGNTDTVLGLARGS